MLYMESLPRVEYAGTIYHVTVRMAGHGQETGRGLDASLCLFRDYTQLVPRVRVDRVLRVTAEVSGVTPRIHRTSDGRRLRLTRRVLPIAYRNGRLYASTESEPVAQGNEHDTTRTDPL